MKALAIFGIGCASMLGYAPTSSAEASAATAIDIALDGSSGQGAGVAADA
jgi:hypothetical protein